MTNSWHFLLCFPRVLANPNRPAQLMKSIYSAKMQERRKRQWRADNEGVPARMPQNPSLDSHQDKRPSKLQRCFPPWAPLGDPSVWPWQAANLQLSHVPIPSLWRGTRWKHTDRQINEFISKKTKQRGRLWVAYSGIETSQLDLGELAVQQGIRNENTDVTRHLAFLDSGSSLWLSLDWKLL